jgi:hypothetical protein
MKRSLALFGVAALLALGLGAPATAQLDNNQPAVRNGGVVSTGGGGADLGSTQMFAVILADGTTARGKGNGPSLRLGTGVYEVLFGRDVRNCSYIAMVGGANFDTPSGVANATNRSGANNGVFIVTRDLTGTMVDLGFHLYVDC